MKMISMNRSGAARWPLFGWLASLAAQEPAGRRALFTCFYSNCDNVVFPASTATLAGADNRFVAGRAHVTLASDPVVMAEVEALLGS